MGSSAAALALALGLPLALPAVGGGLSLAKLRQELLHGLHMGGNLLVAVVDAEVCGRGVSPQHRDYRLRRGQALIGQGKVARQLRVLHPLLCGSAAHRCRELRHQGAIGVHGCGV